MHRCPNRALPLARARDADQLGHGRDGHRGRRRAVRAPALGPRACSARCPTSTGSPQEQLVELDGYAEISAENAVAAIELSKEQPFSRVLFGLNIPDVGWVTARNLARHFGEIDKLLAASQEEIQEVDGIGPDRAEAIAEWFSDEQNRTLVAELRELGLQFEVGEEEKPIEGPLTGAPT